MPLPTVPGYEVRGLLAGGGMGAVYLAHRRGAAGFVRSVAIKVMHTHLASSSEFGAMFVREALLHGRIEHPNVVRVEDFGEFSDGHYLVLEYVDGWSLAQVLRACAVQRVELPVDLAAAIVHAALDGLGAVHDIPSQGGRSVSAVHGDVSPGNILISRAGQVKIIDLGVAATSEEDPFTGQFVRGKAGYVSKEQARAEEIDRRADIYSVGVVFWEMLTCRRLRPGGRGDEPAPAPSTIVESIPREIDAVVLRAMADPVEARYATARDMRRALAAACPSSMFVDAATIADFVLGHLGDALASERARFGATDVTLAAKSVHPGAPASPRTPTPSWPSLPGLRTASAGPLIGRDAELARLSAMFAEGHRVVAVTGAAGVGKTHLSVAAAQRFDRSLVVPVAGVETLGELEHRCRAALQVGSMGSTDVVPLIAEYANDGSIAVVLDGTESLSVEAIDAVHGWCEGVPELRVILATRNTDQGDAARGIRLAPFTVPATAERLRQSPAFALWVHAVQRHDAAYEPEAGTLRDVMEILRLTDGLPLAIRVAAGRMTALGPQAIREELERSVLPLDADDSSAPLRAAAESALKQMDSAGREAAAALAHLAPLFSVRSAMFVLERLEIPGHKRVLEELVTRNVLFRTGTQLSLFSFFRSYLRATSTGGEISCRVVELADEFLRHQVQRAFVDARARVEAEEDTPAYLDAMARLLALPNPEPGAWAWLSDVVTWLCSEQQILAGHPIVVAAAKALLRRGPFPAADTLLAIGLADPPTQERHALSALATSSSVLEPLRVEVAITFGAAWMLTFFGRTYVEAKETAERLRSLASSPEHASVDRLKASLLSSLLLQGMDEPIEAGELVSVLHGLRREGDLHDVANACRLLLQCDESELVERHVRETFPADDPCRTGAAASRLTTHADALLDLGRVTEARALYARTLEHRDPRAAPNSCFRALRGLALCDADQEDYEGARAWAALEHETTTLPALGRHVTGVLAWLTAVTGHERPPHLEQGRNQWGRDRAAADVWWAMADHRAAMSVSSLAALRAVVASTSPMAGQSFALRLALRYAEREMVRGLPGAPGDRKTWAIKDHGACIEPPEGEPIELGAKPLLARLTLALAEARLDGARDGYLTVEEIVQRCWPDERMSDDSAANRVRVCIARLRDVGLRPILEGSRLGYRLRPDLPLVLR